MGAHSTIRDVRFPFKYLRPRILIAAASLLAGYLLWLALHPDAVDAGHTTGAVDVVLRALPAPGRGAACCAMSAFLLYGAFSTYWPCIRDDALVVFDGRTIRGFDIWGRRKTMPRSEVESVFHRYGAASVRGRNGRLWVPISLLDVDDSRKMAIRVFLDAAAA